MLSLLEIGALLLLLQHLLLLLLLLLSLDSEPAGLLDGLGELVAHLLIGLVGGQVQPRGEDNRGSELVHNKDRLPRQGRIQNCAYWCQWRNQDFFAGGWGVYTFFLPIWMSHSKYKKLDFQKPALYNIKILNS